MSPNSVGLSVPFAIIMGLEIVLLCLAPDLATWLPAVLQ